MASRTAGAANLTDASLDSAFHKAIVDNLADGVYYVDRERRITYWNHGAEALTGYPAEAVVGRHCFDNLLKHVDDEGHGLCHDGCPLAATIRDGEKRQFEVWLRHRDGSRRAVRVRTAPIVEKGRVIGAVEVFDDAASLRAARDEAASARHDALTDELTGIPNRRLLNVMLAARLEDVSRYGTSVGLLIADVDHFKGVNDRHGHPQGDAVLRAVASTLQGAIRSADLAARWGGEEFGVILTHAAEQDVREVAERLRVLVAATEVPAEDGGHIAVTISLGGAIAQPGDTPGTLLHRADGALYVAKSTGRNRVVLAGVDT